MTEAPKLVEVYDELIFSGGDVTDIVYDHELCGSFNVTKAAKQLHRAQFRRYDITLGVIEANQQQDVSAERVRTMTEEERDRLGIMVEYMLEGHIWHVLIDGNNRLRRLILDGKRQATCWYFRWPFAQRIKVQTLGRRRDTGVVEPVPVELLFGMMKGVHHKKSSGTVLDRDYALKEKQRLIEAGVKFI